VTTQQRLAEVLVQHPDRNAVRVEYVVSPAELEHRLGLDREEMHLGVGRGVEAIELAERCAGSLTPTDMITDG
jgi:hypothetical protein